MKRANRVEKIHLPYVFPTLLRPIRKNAVNDNNLPILDTIFKRFGLVCGVSVLLYLVQSLA